MTGRQARINLNPELTEITLTPAEWILALQPQITSVEYEIDQVLLQLGGVQPTEGAGGGGASVSLFAPPASNSPGTAGDLAIDDSYLYGCIATNTWRRVAWTEISWDSAGGFIHILWGSLY